jgi:hypothetical protein
VGFSEADSNVGKQRFQNLLGGLLAMKPDDFIADLVRGEHCIQQSFILVRRLHRQREYGCNMNLYSDIVNHGTGFSPKPFLRLLSVGVLQTRDHGTEMASSGWRARRKRTRSFTTCVWTRLAYSAVDRMV